MCVFLWKEVRQVVQVIYGQKRIHSNIQTEKCAPINNLVLKLVISHIYIMLKEPEMYLFPTSGFMSVNGKKIQCSISFKISVQ